MAYTDPIVLADNSMANQTFIRTGGDRAGSDWIENDSTATLQRTIAFRHSNAGASVQKGAAPIRRHLVQFVHTQWNSTLGKMEKMTLNLTLTNDPGSSITAAQSYDLRSFAAAWLTNAHIDSLIRNET